MGPEPGVVHSVEPYYDPPMIQIQPIRALKDNYIWMLYHPDSKKAVVVDPGEAQPLITTLKKQQLTLSAILVTHHHWDHTNGIAELVKNYSVPVYGSHKAPNNPYDFSLKDGDLIELPGLPIGSIAVLEIPGHTLDHLAYKTPSNELFTGDTLFTAGCGRLFEGTADILYNSLIKLKELHRGCMIYCGHEYTLTNLEFALKIEPENRDILERIQETKNLIIKGLPAVPSSMEVELATNPFLRCDLDSVQASVSAQSGQKLTSPVKVFTQLRLLKDKFIPSLI